MKIKLKEVKVELPKVLSFDDYHEIYNLLDHFNELFKGKLKTEELGCNGMYHAIFYLKKDQEYKNLVKEWQNSNREFL